MEKKDYQIEVLNTDIRFICREDETILNAMIRANCGPFHYGCFGGGCGICKMRIVSGQYFAIKKMSRAHITEQELDSGIVLICCVQPRDNVTIARI